MLKSELDLAEARQKITAFIRRKVEESQTDGVVVGLSGGIDSAVTAHLCVGALGSRRIIGMIMPDMRVTPEEDIADAKLIANELGIETQFIDIAQVHSVFMKSFQQNRLAEGNLRARIRMSMLYYEANALNRLVAGTGDRSELLLGYYTKYGDGGVDFLAIADLYKTEVRKLGEILGINRGIISKKSSPRLWPGQLAESEIGLSYDMIDSILKTHFDGGQDGSATASKLGVSPEIVERLITKCGLSAHKRGMPEICKVR